ncbi:MAG: TetR/AcrR family transcriptional regulator [Thermomicrobiales bacterium]
MFIHLEKWAFSLPRDEHGTRYPGTHRRSERGHSVRCPHLFLNRGFANVTMQDIANEAGISAGAIYRYYPGKDELAHAFFEQCAGGGPAAMVRNVAPDAPPVERLVKIVEAVKRMWIENAGEHVIGEIQTAMAGIRQPEEVGPLVHNAREQLYEALTEIVEEGQRTGEIDPEFDPGRWRSLSTHS